MHLVKMQNVWSSSTDLEQKEDTFLLACCWQLRLCFLANDNRAGQSIQPGRVRLQWTLPLVALHSHNFVTQGSKQLHFTDLTLG